MVPTMPQKAQLQSAATYATAVQQEKCPTKEQAIVLDSIDDLTIEDYCVEIGKFVLPINIKFVSRISQKRVCLYLSTVELADKLVLEIKQIKIKEHQLTIQPLYTKTKRILISNVQPLIPSSVIENELASCGITPMSKITHIKASSITTTGFSHLMSFRRQVYIQPEDISKLPETLKISYDDMASWIYFSTDKLICFKCKEEGHTQKFCKNQLNSHHDLRLPLLENTSAPIDEFPKLSEKQTEGRNDSTTNIEPKFLLPQNKRTRSSTASSVSDKDTKSDPKKEQKIRTPSKKMKPLTTLTEITEKLEPALDFLNSNKVSLKMDANEMASFILETYGSSDIRNIASKYTSDLSSLDTCLTQIYSLIGNRHMKSRITKIKKHIKESETHFPISESGSESVDEFESVSFP